MKVVNTKIMRAIEDNAILVLGIPSIILMENAALAVIEECNSFNNILIFCGKGNNGGDGLAIARGLIARGKHVTIVFIGDPALATPDCTTNLNILKSLKAKIIYNNTEVADIIKNSDVVIDSLVGTGLTSGLKEPLATLVALINKYSKYTLSVDCPTGVNSDTGAVVNTAIKANKTITFHTIKLGLLLYPAYSYVGELKIGNISIPEEYTSSPYNILTPSEANNLLPKRYAHSNKGSYGKGYIFAGCNQMPGACVIASRAAYKIGCGLVNACVTNKVAEVIHNLVPEVVTTILPDKDGYICSDSLHLISLQKPTAVAIGSGLGLTKDTIDFVLNIIPKLSTPTVIDADGLNALADNVDILKKANCPIIITPHIGEMSRLTNKSIEDILNDIVGCAVDFSKKYNVITVLKDSHTVIASPTGKVYINTTGTPAMSKAGSGDGLCGAILGLLAQGLEPFESAVLATYICGLAGEIAQNKLGMYGVSVSDTIDCFSQAIHTLQQARL